MISILKKVTYLLPIPFQRYILRMYESYNRIMCKKYSNSVSIKKNKKQGGQKIRVLFYHISGLSFGGTEKSLQILAKYLDRSKYEVYFMYSPKQRSQTSGDGRKSYLEGTGITFIPFLYEKIEPSYPYFVTEMRPSFSEIIQAKEIDIIITAGSGYTEFPFNLIKEIPIILINIFGSPNLQKNITKNVCISNTVAHKIQKIVSEKKIEVMYIQSEKPPELKARELSEKLRKNLGINSEDMVFGRIGRADNAIFDPIGIHAFARVVRIFPTAHYVIMSPPEILRAIVRDQKIPNVHFLEPSADEHDIWAFHYSVDVLAHFRFDGESFGLNIAEAMLAGKPIITHRSHLWNAQTEYLEPTFSRIVNQNDVAAYTQAMLDMINAKKEKTIQKMGILAQTKAMQLFVIDNNIKQFEKWVDEAVY